MSCETIHPHQHFMKNSCSPLLPMLEPATPRRPPLGPAEWRFSVLCQRDAPCRCRADGMLSNIGLECLPDEIRYQAGRYPGGRKGADQSI